MRTEMIDERRQPGYFPYYKLQFLEPHVHAWMDVQRRFTTAHEIANLDPAELPPWARGRQLRIMEVERTGRRPLGPVTLTAEPHKEEPTMATQATQPNSGSVMTGRHKVHFPESFKGEGKLPQGTPYLKNFYRGVQEQDGGPVIDFYGNRYKLQAIPKTDPVEYEVVELLGEAQRQPRGGGRGTRNAEKPPQPAQSAPAAGKANKRGGRAASATQGANAQPATGAKVKRGAGTSSAKTSGSRGSTQTAPRQPAAA